MLSRSYSLIIGACIFVANYSFLAPLENNLRQRFVQPGPRKQLNLQPWWLDYRPRVFSEVKEHHYRTIAVLSVLGTAWFDWFKELNGGLLDMATTSSPAMKLLGLGHVPQMRHWFTNYLFLRIPFPTLNWFWTRYSSSHAKKKINLQAFFFTIIYWLIDFRLINHVYFWPSSTVPKARTINGSGNTHQVSLCTYVCLLSLAGLITNIDPSRPASLIIGFLGWPVTPVRMVCR